jgi:hypothetical protein
VLCSVGKAGPATIFVSDTEAATGRLSGSLAGPSHVCWPTCLPRRRNRMPQWPLLLLRRPALCPTRAHPLGAHAPTQVSSYLKNPQGANKKAPFFGVKVPAAKKMKWSDSTSLCVNLPGAKARQRVSRGLGKSNGGDAPAGTASQKRLWAGLRRDRQPVPGWCGGHVDDRLLSCTCTTKHT